LIRSCNCLFIPFVIKTAQITLNELFFHTHEVFPI
jgi:hypothetical protein